MGTVPEWPDDLDAVDDDPAPPRPRRRTSPLIVVGRVVVGLLSATALAAMSLFYLRVDELDSSKNTTDAVTEAQSGKNAPKQDDGANDILIVGNDSRTDMQGNPLSDELLQGAAHRGHLRRSTPTP